LQVLVILAGLFGILAYFISPENTTIPAYFGIFFPFITLANLILLGAWFLVDKKLALIPLAAFLVSFPFFKRTFTFSFGKKAEDSFKVISFNVKNFDLYNWSGKATTRAEIIKLVREEAPDIACFQEFHDADKEGKRNFDAITEALAPCYSVFATTYDRNGSRFGVALLSKFEILQWSPITLVASKNNTALWADLNLPRDTVRVFNVHLQSINLEYDDYDYLEAPNENQDPSSTRRILSKLNKGLATRALQAEQLADSISKSPHPVLVCGDFNDGPMSYTYQTIRGPLQDAFVKKGIGFGRTYSELKLPILRIDFILAGDEFKINQFRTLDGNLSDHHPIVSHLSLKK
jgi:endonuclease/exonuclease/phosphatase family metal-dependent hydrolase